MIQYTIYKSTEDAARAAAMVYVSELMKNPRAVLGLATGTTPIELYKRLIKLCKKGLIDFSQATTFNLDEYVGISGTHEQSYRYFMNQNLFDHINIDMENTHVPSGMGDVEQNAREYDQMIDRAGGIDLQLLGIGQNGHVGFNEPSDAGLPRGTSIVKLTQSTIDANSRLFERREDVPQMAISLGMGGIMGAKRIILIATGSNKADAIAGAINGPVTTKNPASLLQLHSNVQFLLDEEAAAML